jgi:dTDP-4-dehydrorhamnose reductase
MKVLLTGSSGQLSQAFKYIFLKNDIDFIALNKFELDVSCQKSLLSSLSSLKPKILINTAAYTNVDLAETHIDQAFLINEHAPSLMAKICNDLGITLIHFSTDYVFDGLKKKSYNINDSTNPINEYGKSKRAGEIEIQKNCSNYLIFRSSWLFSQYKTNFLKTILNLSSSDQELSIISDQFGTPTSANDLAEAVFSILPRIANGDFSSGIYHYAGEQIFSWNEFANEIFIQAFEMKLIKKLPAIIKITTQEYDAAAPRPLFSALDSFNAINEFKMKPSDTYIAIVKVLNALKKL